MKAIVFGAGGMLGRAIVEELEQRGSAVYAFTHDEADITDMLSVIDALAVDPEVDVVFNAAGILNTSRDRVGMVRVNALGPHILAMPLGVTGTPLIHVSTDCVFSGRSERWAPPRHGYTVNHAPNPVDLYGRTKLVGEVEAPHVTNVRTSFVGPDHGLWAWVVEQARAEATVEGWSRAFWSGSTVWAVAARLVDLAGDDTPPGGVLHLATEEPITKHGAVQLIARHEGIPLAIVEDKRTMIDRTLYPTHPLESFADALKRHHS